ncbi:MAG: nicotinamide-nucleotide adenylyltransferase [Candidatus Peribacteraceae bacterium]|nr:nicotinamide-nucleotide adenylyltransferase [Candidatus Peribacteraceae bacterium]
MKALFFGRFQPFHNGHLKVIKEIHNEYDYITIVVCGPNNPDEKNPFTFEERKEMIDKALHETGIHYDVREIVDVNDDEKWSNEVIKLGMFDTAFSRNSWTIRCLIKIGANVKEHDLYGRAKQSGTQIRKNILEGNEWKELVPREVYGYIKSINGEERLKKTFIS